MEPSKKASKQAAFAREREEKRRREGERDGCANLGFCLPACSLKSANMWHKHASPRDVSYLFEGVGA
jgi:hypothetical protein